MGCDIHVMVEARDFPGGGSATWRNVDNWRHNPYFGVEDGEQALLVQPIYSSRNYELFGFLADVRNYGGNISFDFDRGFPEDADEHTAAEYERWDCDAHTPGYATLAELKEKIKGVAKVTRKGFVRKEQIQRHKDTGETPDEWCQGVGGPGSEQYEWYEWEEDVHCFDRLLEAIEERKRDVFWIFNAKSDDGSMDSKIRIVFWFDN